MYVSVPSRGLCFQSTKQEKVLQALEVSVPSRGLCFQSKNAQEVKSEYRRCFRPLSGIMFSISTWYNITIEGKRKVVSVPSRGLCFQSKNAR